MKNAERIDDLKKLPWLKSRTHQNNSGKKCAEKWKPKIAEPVAWPIFQYFFKKKKKFHNRKLFLCVRMVFVFWMLYFMAESS